jgi:hypothetical protein
MTANPTRGAWLVRRATLDEEIARLTKRLAEPSDRSSPHNRLLDFESRRRAQERLTVALAERLAHGSDPGPNAVEFGFDWLAGHTRRIAKERDVALAKLKRMGAA